MISVETADIRRFASPLVDSWDLDPLLERVGRNRFVLIGEASHGTAEFYRWRATITRRLIEEKGFTAVAVEGDWPDCVAIHRCVTAAPGAPEDPRAVLEGLERWPTWIWANEEVLEFCSWLREYNVALPSERRVGFFGLDVYSLWSSLRSVLDYLERNEPGHVDAALEAYRCFEPYAEDPESYARANRLVPSDCESEVVSLLTRLRRDDPSPAGSATPASDADFDRFVASQNAEVVANAEHYYRAMLRGGPDAWNIRDHHMVDTLDRLVDHYGPGGKVVVWAHNTHVGDARATDMARIGMVNVGQLVRERHADEGVVIVGFGTYSGGVIAANHWGHRPRESTVPPARNGSLERLLHGALPGRNTVLVFPTSEPPAWLGETWDHRAIGVVYHPKSERWGNYVPTTPGRRYDAFVHCDRSNALTPLHPYEPAPVELGTYPSGA